MREQFHDLYTIEQKIIPGSISKVYKVILNETGEKYICKRIENDRFRKEEINNPMKINSDRVVKSIGHYEEDGFHYIIFENDPDLEDLFEYIRDKNLTEENIKPIIMEMMLCLQECHKNNIAHLDIKAENFIITQKNPIKLKLIDFGSSHLADTKRLKKIQGTLLYCAPEILNKKFYLSSDVWSIGAFIFYCITNNTELSISKVYTYTMINNESFSENLKDLLNKMLHYNPKKRYSIEKCISHQWFTD